MIHQEPILRFLPYYYRCRATHTGSSTVSVVTDHEFLSSSTAHRIHAMHIDTFSLAECKCLNLQAMIHLEHSFPCLSILVQHNVQKCLICSCYPITCHLTSFAELSHNPECHKGIQALAGVMVRLGKTATQVGAYVTYANKKPGLFQTGSKPDIFEVRRGNARLGHKMCHD